MWKLKLRDVNWYVQGMLWGKAQSKDPGLPILAASQVQGCVSKGPEAGSECGAQARYGIRVRTLRCWGQMHLIQIPLAHLLCDFVSVFFGASVFSSEK